MIRFLLLPALLLHTGLYAQICGNDAASQRAWLPRYEDNLRAAPDAGRGGLRQVPVVFHLVGRTNGSSRASVWRALAVLCEWNQVFAPVGFAFSARQHDFAGTAEIFAANHEKIDAAGQAPGLESKGEGFVGPQHAFEEEGFALAGKVDDFDVNALAALRAQGELGKLCEGIGMRRRDVQANGHCRHSNRRGNVHTR